MTKQKKLKQQLSKANREIAQLKLNLQYAKNDYEFLWKMRIQDEMERKRK